MTEIIKHPLKSIVIADENVRKDADADGDIPALANLIAEEGLQQPLCGYRKGKTQIAVYDGRRRLLALRLLEKEDRLPKDCRDGVPVRLGTKALARQASLSAGLSHRGFHPAEEHRQFAALVEDGRSVRDIAKLYSMSERDVERRLRLARLAPMIFAAFARDDLSLEQAQAYALTDDQDRQMRLLEAGGYGASAYSIRRALTEGEIPATDKRAKLIGDAAYEAAGGTVRRDLFGGGGDTFTDPVLLDMLVQKALEDAAGAVNDEGWSWVQTMAEFDHGLHTTHFRVHASKAAFPDDVQADYDKAKERHAALIGDDDEGGDLTEAEWEEVDALETRMDDIEAAHMVYTDADKERGGAVVYLRHDGVIDVMRGLVKREKQTKGEGENAAIPHALHRRLTETATECLARELANDVEVADIVLTTALAQAALGSGAAPGIKIALSGLALSPDAGLPVDHQLAERQESQAECVGFDFTETLAKIAALSPTHRSWIKATAVAVSLDFSEPRGDQRSTSARRTAEAVAAMLGCDVARHWTPDAAFFTKMPRAALLAALKEMGREDASLEKAKKADLADLAARHALSCGWLPEPIRFVHAPKDRANADAA
ncbi:MAG: ParB N-terminal domain-containing protein [Pseudomonadota bacterium]